MSNLLVRGIDRQLLADVNYAAASKGMNQREWVIWVLQNVTAEVTLNGRRETGVSETEVVPSADPEPEIVDPVEEPPGRVVRRYHGDGIDVDPDESPVEAEEDPIGWLRRKK